ncbi:putative aminotransferase [Lachnellula willkommii]|uniref:Putative aminotransferase n=1 Tax=Lachnellula willkommii TaxID=215461 RepID=A0A559MA86_9HELO|nr:putative aminotransferase [Lachnellula willkommii]
MISSRGQAYAQSGLMDSYARNKKASYNKDTAPEGEFLLHDTVHKFISDHSTFEASHLTYNEGPIGTLRLRKAMAAHINKHFSPFNPITAENVTFTAGVTGLNEMITLSLVDEGEGILLGRPIYGAFRGDMTTRTKYFPPRQVPPPVRNTSMKHQLTANRSKLVYASFGKTDQFSTEAVKKYEEALLQAQKDGITIKALVLCNPHNPLGRCYPVETLKALFALCEKYNLHLVSDEIYALSVFDVEGAARTPFTSVLSIDPTGVMDPGRIHVMYGMSKDFGAAGIRLGCLVSRNDELTKATQAIARFNWPSGISVSIATTVLEDTAFVEDYTKKSRSLLAEHYALATRTLDDAGIDYSRDGFADLTRFDWDRNAGFFLWIDLSPFLSDASSWEAEKALKEKLSRHGVELASGLGYMEETPGWFRVIFTVERDALVEGLRR